MLRRRDSPGGAPDVCPVKFPGNVPAPSLLAVNTIRRQQMICKPFDREHLGVPVRKALDEGDG